MRRRFCAWVRWVWIGGSVKEPWSFLVLGESELDDREPEAEDCERELGDGGAVRPVEVEEFSPLTSAVEAE
jgi:hypothetical protein